MILVGLTGGLATGKSTVARLFRDCGAVVLDADVLARQVVTPGKPAWKDIVRAFGNDILHTDRTLDRAALARLVFRNRAKLRKLNAIVHPRVAREQARLTREIARQDPKAVVVYDAPLLFEAGVDKRVDTIIVVAVDRETQIHRLMRRNGLTRAEAIRRIRAQISLPQKRRRAQYVLEGSQPLPRLRTAVQRTFADLKRHDGKAVSVRSRRGRP
ncbi:MAG TPA: dephospho-CoA kinase [Nitrospiraceae bacterium]|nr:dephospho-CoA kinase [Nitrospiraceae bacterium]